ncbi:hypothetical protein M0R45_020221 [Rubus argutus]|uniref:glucan endo-1,3-beta-D-glucosidase n=1 Tax=Rubus argutus TaxID=59490 RepID=A0AAW1X8K4_RUBAR
MVPLLRFLNRTKSFFFIDVYPFFPWSSNPVDISLDYALLRNISNNTRLPNIRLLIAETGWPNSGGEQDQPGANVHNAATYNRNLVQKIVAKPTIGTPARPGVVIPTFIFSLYDENQKGGPGTERHWGLLYPDGTPVYDIDLTGKRPANDYEPLPEKKHFIKGIHYDD